MFDPERQRRVGATDVSAILGLSKWADALDVYERIVNGIERPWNKGMKRGFASEDTIRALAVERYGFKLQPRPGTVQSKRWPWACASPDDLIETPQGLAVVDYKSWSRWAAKSWGLEGTDQVPDAYLVQIHWQMAVCERPLGRLVVAFGEDAKGPPPTFEIQWTNLYVFERDPAFEDQLGRAVETFWREHVEKRIPPPRTLKKKTKSKEAA